MSANPNICIIKTDGVNCDQEMQYAIDSAGATTDIVHINDIRHGRKQFADYAGIGIAGGFSYGDDIASGAVLANELTQFLGDELQEAVDEEKPIIGVCNGFQVLVRTGLLPEGEMGERKATLAQNAAGHFVCKWVELQVPENACRFLPAEAFESAVPMQIAHGEGRFVANEADLDAIAANRQVAFTYEKNPNGSMRDIAGICNPEGTILGMMPHPERSIASMHPDRSRTEEAKRTGEIIFSNFVKYARSL
jgi:phosphoribosylformylglycinamidine synthase I